VNGLSPMTRAARAVSLVFNPSLWAGGFVVYLALRFEPAGAGRWIVAALGAAFVGGIPIALLFVLKAAGRLRDVEMRERTERGTVYAACAASYAAGALLLAGIGAEWPVWGVVAVHTPTALVLAALNRRWKVSIHAAGLAGIVAAAAILFGAAAWPLAIILAAGAWARWAAGAHSVGELAGGTLTGALFTSVGLAAVRLLVTG